ncbi:hypothetical protein Tco_0452849 [Tanacetum coccineum]
MQNTMAEQNVPAQAPTRTDEQIVPRSQWLQIKKSNLLFDAQKIQKNPIFQISVDILRNTNFLEVHLPLACVPDIYIQSLELMIALDITHVDLDHPFELPLTGDTVIDFVNQLGYPEPNCYGKSLLRFTKMIIYYLGSTSDVHKRPKSPCHLPGDDFLLGNLKFISKGETDEVFGMAIPKQLITQAIQQSSYYPKYLEMKPTTTTPVKPTKTPSSKQPKSLTKKPSKQEGDDPTLELTKKISLDAHQEKGEGEGSGHLLEDSRQGSSIENIPNYLMYETEAVAPKGDKEQGEVASSTVTSGVGISVHTEDQAGSDPGKAHEALAGPDPKPMQEDQTGSDSGKVHVSLAGPNPEHTDEDFLATANPR